MATFHNQDLFKKKSSKQNFMLRLFLPSEQGNLSKDVIAN